MAGALAGVLVGVLFAPDSGIKTRKKIARGARDLEEEMERMATKKLRGAKEAITDKMEDYKERGKTFLKDQKEHA